MRIAFDLNDTLIETTTRFAVGTENNPWWCRYFFRGKLRTGTRNLLKELSLQHELWIYTNSLRRIWSLKLWFTALGIPVKGIINRDVQEALLKNRKYSDKFSKIPIAFGIDLLIDDSPGVALECQRQGCDFLLLEPLDLQWIHRLKNKVLLVPSRCD